MLIHHNHITEIRLQTLKYIKKFETVLSGRADQYKGKRRKVLTTVSHGTHWRTTVKWLCDEWRFRWRCEWRLSVECLSPDPPLHRLLFLHYRLGHWNETRAGKKSSENRINWTLTDRKKSHEQIYLVNQGADLWGTEEDFHLTAKFVSLPSLRILSITVNCWRKIPANTLTVMRISVGLQSQTN